jgi:hypothetical protein
MGISQWVLEIAFKVGILVAATFVYNKVADKVAYTVVY